MENLINFTQKDIELIKSQIAPEANQKQIELLIYQSQKTGLNPLTRQIYAIFRNGKMSIQTSIDGFRVIAERSGSYAGQSEPVFVEKEGELVACKISVFRFKDNIRYEASVGVAYWDEYCQKFNGKVSGMWAKMPRTMLAKVAEALALRKAYPQDLSGIYTNDEMSQADNNNDNIILQEPKKSMKGLAKIADENLIEGREQKKEDKRRKSEEKFAELKAKIEGCGSGAEIEAIFENEEKSINYLKKSQPDLYELLVETKLEMINEIGIDN